MTTRLATFITAILFLPCLASAGIMLFDDPDRNFSSLAFNVDGNSTELFPADTAPEGIDFSNFDSTSGLGTVRVAVAGAGGRSVIAFFDHEIDASTNSYFDEYGEAIGASSANQSWEIDEPGFVFGDTFDNFGDGVLDNSNSIEGQNFPEGDDVSMAMGWDFNLSSDESAIVSFLL